jgi:hypothetical protein
MKYIITENRMIDLVEKLIHTAYPKFNKKDAKVLKWNDDNEGSYYEYYDGETGRPFAKYWTWGSELQLHHELFNDLENYFGEDNVEYILDWFNREFNQKAESVTS